MVSFLDIVNNYSPHRGPGTELETMGNNQNPRGYSSVVNDTNELISKTKNRSKMIQMLKKTNQKISVMTLPSSIPVPCWPIRSPINQLIQD